MINIDTGYVNVTIHDELLLVRAGHVSEGGLPEKLEEEKIYKFEMKGHHIYPLKRINLYSTDVALCAPESIRNRNKLRIGEVSVLEVTLASIGGSALTTGEYIVTKLLKEPKKT